MALVYKPNYKMGVDGSKKGPGGVGVMTSTDRMEDPRLSEELNGIGLGGTAFGFHNG